MRSIKSIIFYWFLLNVGSVLLVLTISLYFLSERLIEGFILQDHIRIVEHLSANIQNQFKDKLRALDVVAVDFEKNDLSILEAKKLLEQLFHFQRSFTAAHVYEPDGKFLFNVRRSDIKQYRTEKNIFEISYVDKEFFETFKLSIKNKRPYLSKLYKSTRGFTYQTYFLPLIQNGAVKYVLSGAISPQSSDLSTVTHGFSLSDNNFISFYSKEIGFFNSSQLPKSLQQPLLKNIDLPTDNKPFTFEYRVENTKYYMLARFLPEVNAWILMGIHPKILNQKLNTVYKYLLIFIVFISLIGFTFSYFLGRRLASPVDAAIDVLKQYHIGNFKAKLKHTNRDDFLFLAQLINRFGDKLEKDQILGMYWSNEDELRKIKAGEKIE
jgi:hypothetical protein